MLNVEQLENEVTSHAVASHLELHEYPEGYQFKFNSKGNICKCLMFMPYIEFKDSLGLKYNNILVVNSTLNWEVELSFYQMLDRFASLQSRCCQYHKQLVSYQPSTWPLTVKFILTAWCMSLGKTPIGFRMVIQMSWDWLTLSWDTFEPDSRSWHMCFPATMVWVQLLALQELKQI